MDGISCVLPIRWGIAGTGSMAKTFAKAIIDHPQSELCAIGSRSLEKAQALAQKLGVPRGYGSYADLASDPDIAIVHVATPNSYHFEHAKLFLEHGKHVLCEKTFTCSAQQAQELVELARSRDCLLVEGMWTRFFFTLRLGFNVKGRHGRWFAIRIECH